MNTSHGHHIAGTDCVPANVKARCGGPRHCKTEIEHYKKATSPA